MSKCQKSLKTVSFHLEKSSLYPSNLCIIVSMKKKIDFQEKSLSTFYTPYL